MKKLLILLTILLISCVTKTISKSSNPEIKLSEPNSKLSEGDMFLVTDNHYHGCIAVVKDINNLEIGTEYLCRVICTTNENWHIFYDNVIFLQVDGQLILRTW